MVNFLFPWFATSPCHDMFIFEKTYCSLSMNGIILKILGITIIYI